MFLTLITVPRASVNFTLHSLVKMTVYAVSILMRTDVRIFRLSKSSPGSCNHLQASHPPIVRIVMSSVFKESDQLDELVELVEMTISPMSGIL